MNPWFNPGQAFAAWLELLAAQEAWLRASADYAEKYRQFIALLCRYESS